ncbi:MAG TPA: hypothetical protein VLH79_12305 [Chthonomonadales bacterium]|nr:hypothetical protein [Chthonomonadales bacterium]
MMTAPWGAACGASRRCLRAWPRMAGPARVACIGRLAPSGLGDEAISRRAEHALPRAPEFGPSYSGTADRCIDICRSIGIEDHHADQHGASGNAIAEAVEHGLSASSRHRFENLRRGNDRRIALLACVRRPAPALAAR